MPAPFARSCYLEIEIPFSVPDVRNDDLNLFPTDPLKGHQANTFRYRNLLVPEVPPTS